MPLKKSGQNEEQMEFCPEIAVLVSAGELAAKPETPVQKQFEIFKTAVEEIRTGIESNISTNQTELWEYKLHALLFSSTLRSFLQEHDSAGSVDDWGYLKSVLTILPPITREVYYGLVQEFHWRRYLIECLLFLNDGTSLQLSEDILCFCWEDRHENTANNCELLLALVETYLELVVSGERSSGKRDTKGSAASRKVSGLYVFMGKTSPAQSPSAKNVFSEEHRVFLQRLLSYIKRLVCSDEVLNSLENVDDVSQMPAFHLLSGVIALGGIYLLPQTTKFDSVFFDNPRKWSKVLLRKWTKQEEQNPKAGLQAFQNVLARLKSENFSNLTICLKSLSSFANGNEQEEVTFFSVPSQHYFPTCDWMGLLQEVLHCSQWVKAFIKAVEFWEDRKFTPAVKLVTMDIKLPNLFIVLGELLAEKAKLSEENIAMTTKREGASLSPKQSQLQPDDKTDVVDTNESSSSFPVTGDIPMEGGSNVSSGNITDLISLLQPVIKHSSFFLEKLSQFKSRKRSVDVNCISVNKAVEAVENLQPGWENCLDKLLSIQNIFEFNNNSVLEVLEKNQNLLSTESRVRQLFDLVQRAERQNTERGKIQQMWKMLLAVFSELPVMIQDHLLSTWYRDSYCVTPESDPDYVESLISVFNRLVDGGHSETVDVIRLVLQSPQSTLTKAVTVAVKNKHHSSVIVKILQNIPSVCLCKQPPNEENSLLCGCILSYLATNTLSSAEEENLLGFLALAVQKFENASFPKMKFMENPILDAEEFLHLAVVPYLSRENMVEENQAITAKLALQVFNCLGGEKCCENVSQPFVILLCLCEMLQECDVFWDCHCRKDQLKQDIVTAIGYLPLEDSAARKGPGGFWFRQQLARFNIAVIVRVRTVLEMDEEDCVQIMSDHLWIEEQLEDTGSRGDNHYKSAFQFASIDDTCLQFSLHSLSQIKGQFTFDWENIVLMLAEVLPNLLHTEWLRVLIVCEHLMVKGRLVISYPCTFLKTLPLIDFTGIQIPLGLTKLLADVCTVWSQSESLTQAAWLFAAQGLATSVRDMCLFEKKLEDHFKPRTFLLAQIFCLLCQMMNTLPTQASDHLYLVMLHTLNMYKGVKSEGRTACSEADWRALFFQCKAQEQTMTEVLEICVRDGTSDRSNLQRQLEEINQISL